MAKHDQVCSPSELEQPTTAQRPRDVPFACICLRLALIRIKVLRRTGKCSQVPIVNGECTWPIEGEVLYRRIRESYWCASCKLYVAQLWVLANPANPGSPARGTSHYSFVKGIHTEVPILERHRQQPRRSPIHVTRKVHGYTGSKLWAFGIHR